MSSNPPVTCLARIATISTIDIKNKVLLCRNSQRRRRTCGTYPGIQILARGSYPHSRSRTRQPKSPHLRTGQPSEMNNYFFLLQSPPGVPRKKSQDSQTEKKKRRNQLPRRHVQIMRGAVCRIEESSSKITTNYDSSFVCSRAASQDSPARIVCSQL